MLKKRITPCLDAKDERVVKGINFISLTDTGDPVDAVCAYCEAGCGELIFLDITVAHEERNTAVEMVKRVANQVFIPFTAGGGIRSVEDMNKMPKTDADKVAVSFSTMANSQLIKDYTERFGGQCAVSAIDTRKEADDIWHVYVAGGRKDAGIDLIRWAKITVSLGVDGILLANMDKDGTKLGFDLDTLNVVANVVSAPTIISGGAGNIDHMVDVFGKATAIGTPAASIFHLGEVSVTDTKATTAVAGIEVRQ